ncbi:ABC transporter permease [Aeromicrobium sp. PE09-221]|uniref:ABC transporter permease n=1 Tax=Aeromicrobium sp. PE09-221 TaxID=1898043 RepID=UPI000B3E9CB1|nr:ABC transporter permease [Aeromicrobium sp. PE09-221]OUZ09745.1 ABC transporter permease [Aeromicrobium sp. PE09-221]
MSTAETATLDTATAGVSDSPGIARYVTQPLVCVLVVVGCLVFVQTADVSDSEARALAISNLLPLFGQHLSVSLIATVVTVVVAVPIGVLLTRGPMRRYSKPIITVAGFGQAAPAIGLIALGAAIFGIGTFGAAAALVVYGLLPIIANTVAGIDSVDPKLVEAGRGMGMSGFSTLVRVEVPLALPIIVAGVRTALVLIVGTAALVSFTGGGGLGHLITSGIKLQQNVVLIIGALLIASLALFIDWIARVVEIVASPKGV